MNKFEVGLITTSPYAQVMRSRIWTMSCTNCCGDGLKGRHPKKNKWWISTRYWHRVGNRNWVFSTENKELIRVDSTAIVRHTKIKATANPFLDEAYFQKRKFDKGMHRLTGKFKMIWKNQNGTDATTAECRWM